MIYPRHIVYSLEALAYMATQPSNKYLKVHEMASALSIPRHFLGKVLTDLVRKHLVTSIKGPAGGFVLAARPSSITIYRILAELGALTKLEDSCVMGFRDCTEQTPCAFHNLWSEFKIGAISQTQKLTLEEFSTTLFTKLSKVKLDYSAANTPVLK
jgi:Rrf2 family protein